MARPVSVFIDDTLVTLDNESLNLEDRIEERSVASFTTIDIAGTASYYRGQPVAIYSGAIDTPSGTPVFSGFIDTPEKQRLAPYGGLNHGITCADNHYLADKRIVAKVWENKTAEYIVTDLITSYLAAEGITVGEIQTGLTFKRVVANYVSASDVIQALADACGDQWYINSLKALYFIARETNAAPWAVTVDKMLDNPKPRLSKGNPQYRNRQYVRGGTALTSVQTENFTGDGVMQSFACGYPIQLEPTISEDGYLQTVGIKGLETGKDYYWSKDDSVIYADAVPGDGVVIEVEYYGKYKVISLVSNTAEIASQKSVEGGGTGWVENSIVNTDIESKEEASEFGMAKLTEFCRDAERFSFLTKDSGLAAGQLATVTYSPFGFSAHEMLIESVVITTRSDKILYSVTAITGPVFGSWTRLFKSLSMQNAGIIKLGQDEQVIALLQQTETLAFTEATDIHTDSFISGIVNRWLNSAPIDSGSLVNVEHEAFSLSESTSRDSEYTEEYAWG